MINIENLYKDYGRIHALRGISMHIGKGEIVGLLGPNGAGKSTAMNILTGYLSCTSGKAEVGGVDIFEDPIEAKKLIGFLPELPPLYLDMTVREYLNFVYELKSCRLEKQKHISDICSVVEITDHMDRLIRNLSKGYRQRVGIAQALIGNPPVLVFDEPTVGLDPKQIVEVRELIAALGKTHTVILSTHILQEVQAVCDRIIIINKGKIIADEKTENISDVLTSGREINVKICGGSDEVLQAIKKLPGIHSVDSSGKSELDSTTYHIISMPGIDIRKSLFTLCASRSWYIIGLEAVGMDLESIFLSAVDEDAGGSDGRKRKEK